MPENDYIIEKIISHNYSRLIGSPDMQYREPGKKPGMYNDIALLKLNKDIKFGPQVKSLQIAPEEFNELKYSDKAIIIGWGTTDTLDVSDNSQKANLVLRSDKTCFEYVNGTPWPRYNRSETLLCVGGIRDGVWSPVSGRGDRFSTI